MFSFLRNFGQSEHQRVEEMLSAYIDGELTPEERARVERHLAQCEACARNLRTLRQTVGLLRELPTVPVPRSFVLRPAARPVRARPTYAYFKWATALAAALLVVALAGDFILTGLAPARKAAPLPTVPVMEKRAAEELAVEVAPQAPGAATPSPAPAEEGPVRALAATPSPAPLAKGLKAGPTEAPVPTPEALAARAPRPWLPLLRLAEAGLLLLFIVLAAATLALGRRWAR